MFYSFKKKFIYSILIALHIKLDLVETTFQAHLITGTLPRANDRSYKGEKNALCFSPQDTFGGLSMWLQKKWSLNSNSDFKP